MPAEKNTLQERLMALQPQIVAKAVKDEAFRQHLLNNPKLALERELGLAFPQGVTVQVHEEGPTILHLVLPMKPLAGELQELSDEELEEVSGGDSVYGNASHPHMWSQQDTVGN